MSEVGHLPHKDFPFDHLSPSSINRYDKCPLSFLYYKEGKPKQWDPRYAEQGRYTHSVIQRIYDQDAEVYETEMDHEMLTRHVASMEGWRALCKEDRRFLNSGEYHPEYRIEVEISGVPVLGYIDLLTKRGSMIYIDDWKTGLYKADDEAQIRTYVMMVSEIMEISPRMITATLDYLRNEPGRIQHRVPYTSTAALKHHIIHDVIEPIKDLQFLPRQGKGCARCEYRHCCEAW